MGNEIKQDYRKDMERLNELRGKYLKYATGPAMGKVENKLMAKHLVSEIKNHKRGMKSKEYL